MKLYIIQESEAHEGGGRSEHSLRAYFSKERAEKDHDFLNPGRWSDVTIEEIEVVDARNEARGFTFDPPSTLSSEPALLEWYERCADTVAGFRMGWADAIKAAANDVASHWNDPRTLTNQKEQAIRSAEAIRRIQPPSKEPHPSME